MSSTILKSEGKPLPDFKDAFSQNEYFKIVGNFNPINREKILRMYNHGHSFDKRNRSCECGMHEAQYNYSEFLNGYNTICPIYLEKMGIPAPVTTPPELYDWI